MCPGSLKPKGRYAVTETDDLKLPLRSGWKRETTIREYSKSGIRGEVIYIGPCGKKFKQYPDITRVSRISNFAQHKGHETRRTTLDP